MKKQGKRITALTVSAMLMLNMASTAVPVSAEGESKVYTHDGYTVEYTVKNEWTGNQNIEVTITNTGDDVLSGWAMGYNAFGEIGGLWNAQIYGHQGTEYILSSAGYNDELAPGQSTNFGYTLTGDKFKIPQNIVNCAERVDITEGYNVYYNITADFVDTYQAEMIIENTSDTDISAWQLSFDGNVTINDLWNGKLIENSNGSFKVKNSENNSVIAAGSSVSFNFGGTKNTESEPNLGYSEPVETLPPVPVVTDEFSEAETAAESAETDAANPETDPAETEIPSETVMPEITTVTESVVMPVSEVVFSNYKLTGMVIPMEFDFEIDPEVDSDNDGLPDYLEKELGTDRYNADTDGDGLPDGYEYFTLGTDPKKADSDDNGISDADEDFDEDGLTNLEEYELGTDPFSKDTDNDGLSDYDEVKIHNTDPLKYDTDGDKVSDGDEVILGLDPNNPATFGYPDNEYTTVQTVGEGSSALDYINNIEDNPYSVTIEITAAGVADNNLTAGESGYSYSILQNDAVLGVVPEFDYSDGLSVTDVVIKFKIDESAIGAPLDSLMIFKYFEDTNMLLPIETTYDNTTNSITTHVDELGTYCLINIEKMAYNIENMPTGNYYDAIKNEPANIVFCLDTRNITDNDSFENVKSDIKAISENAFDRYDDIKIYVYYQRFGSNFRATNHLLKDENGNEYFTSYDEAEKALDKLERFLIKSSFWTYDLVEATQFMIDTCDDKIIAMYHIAADDCVMGSIDDAKKLTQTVCNSKYTTANDEKIQRIYVSTLCPNSAEPFDTDSYAYKLAELSGGIAVTGYDMVEETEIQPFSIEVSKAMSSNTSSQNSVISNLKQILGEGDEGVYKIISSAGWTTIKLNNPLNESSSEDYDEDGLSDWDEVNTDLIYTMYTKNNHSYTPVIKSSYLPTLADCKSYYTDIDNQKIYVKSGYEIFEQYMRNELLENGVAEENIDKEIAKIRILPICSNPADPDSDGDRIVDCIRYFNSKKYTQHEFGTDKYHITEFNDPNPLKFDYLWQWPVISEKAVLTYKDSEDKIKCIPKLGDNGEKLIYKNKYKCKNLQSSFVEGRKNKDGTISYHKAIDISTKDVDVFYVIAAFDGEVMKTSNTCTHVSEKCSCGGKWGNYIAINSTINGITYTALYAHLKYNSIMVSETQKVHAGDIIAIVGSSGKSDGTHLDFSIRIDSDISSKIIGQTCYDPLLFNSYYKDGTFTPCQLNHCINLPVDLTKACGDPSDGCEDYYPLVEDYYKINMIEYKPAQ